MGDDVLATLNELRSKGVEVAQEMSDQRWGRAWPRSDCRWMRLPARDDCWEGTPQD
jgi:hypothetical protein